MGIPRLAVFTDSPGTWFITRNAASRIVSPACALNISGLSRRSRASMAPCPGSGVPPTPMPPRYAAAMPDSSSMFFLSRGSASKLRDPIASRSSGVRARRRIAMNSFWVSGVFGLISAKFSAL